MTRFLKTKKETIGLSPDEVFFIGEKKCDSTGLNIYDFDAENLTYFDIKTIGDIAKFDKTKSTTWINVYGLHNEETIKEVTSEYGLNSLVLSDILDTHARPKIHEYDNCIYISVKLLQLNETNYHISTENLVLIIKENILLSFQEREGDFFNPVREQLRKNKKRIRKSGTDYLAFALLDVVIDNYMYILSRVGERIDLLEEKLLKNLSTNMGVEINKYKGDIVYIQRAIIPCREVIMSFVKMDSELLSESVFVHLKELQNNIIYTNETINSYREILTNQLSVLHTTISNNLNDILKLLTIFSVVFIPLTFITGVYGTNFDNIPELRLKWGYYMMWAAIVIIAIVMVLFFKKKKWY